LLNHQPPALLVVGDYRQSQFFLFNKDVSQKMIEEISAKS